MHNEIVNLGCFVEITSTRLLRQMASPRPSKKMKLEDIPPALVSDQEECCLDILHFAHQYEMNLLLNIAEIRLIEYTTTASEKIVIERLFLADELLLKDLANASEKRIGQHFLKIIFSEFLSLTLYKLLLDGQLILSQSRAAIPNGIVLGDC